MLTTTLATTYEEACDLIRRIGILPLSSFIPDHPSLESVTPKEQWHNGEENDPWLWRDRFAADGVAAYGRFFKKKPVLIARELFPAVRERLGDGRSVQARYDDGDLSRAALQIYRVVEEEGGIDTKALRAAVGLKAAEDKAEYDRALIELQATGDLVIAGIAGRLTEKGVKSGWNSTCYEHADRWLEQHGTDPAITSEAARALLTAHLDKVCEEKAAAFLKKVFSL
jgi:hypothetical protein